MRRIIPSLLILLVLLLESACAGPVQQTRAPVAPATSELEQQTEAPAAPATTGPVQLPNPASQNCVEQGGTLSIETRGDGGQYGICYFEDNRQCEEWALMRGECPVGGLKITGYITDAAQYCAITGGTYTIIGNSGQNIEQGTCTLPNGAVCDVWDYWNGVCTSETETPAANWQWYVIPEVGYALQVPETWSEQTMPDQNDGAIHGKGYTGAEGGLDVYWGAGFGGACPSGTQPVQLAQGEVEACYAAQSDGTEDWSQIGYQVEGGNSFSVRAYTNDTQPSSHDLVLKALSTLTFRMPATTAIQPLSMEVCDGQAQAMSHTLDDLIPTQSEVLLDDYLNNAWGTGCRSTITGTGTGFESPAAVVDQLGAMLEGQGWTADPQLAADGPTGSSQGYRNGEQICWAGAGWEPAESANCPADQPITACEVAPEQQNYTVTLDCGVEVPVGESNPVGPAQIVFDSDRGGDQIRDLYTMTSDGYDLSRLTRRDANSFAGPWSPDVQRILYTSFGPTNSYIAVINADGSGSTILDQVEGSDEGFPAWSPDGTRIAFTSRRDGNNEIYVMNADGSNPVRLTDNSRDDFAPSWSPDGSRIAFVSDRDQAQGINDIFIMNADGSSVTHLTNDQAIDYAPAWSPDGTQIVFRSDEGGQSDIFVINVDGSERRNLTNSPGYDWSPSWSPDGTQIAFQTNRDGNFEIYLMNADGSGPINLTNDPSDDQLPFWRP